ncbi:MAG: hypothetical protein M3Q71_14965 [Chloroflexota bacterium]|nr:hypothetical protein [Chloroflexota bacterium]
MSGLRDFVTPNRQPEKPLSLADLNAALDEVLSLMPAAPTQEWIVSKPAYDRVYRAYWSKPRRRLGLQVTVNRRVKRKA